MGCSNDAEKPLNKRNKKIKRPSKPENILNHNKNFPKDEKEDDKDNSNKNSEDNSNNEDNDNDEENDRNEEDNFPAQNLLIPNFQPYLQSKNDPYFNFPEVKENKFVGKGLKRMKGYISNIPEDELKKKREAFWGTRVEGNKQTWNFLKEICEMPPGEEKNLDAMLQAYDLTPYKNCINVSYDALGALYEIPNYCIHDPMVYDLPEDHKKKPAEKKIKYKARHGAKILKLKSSNYSSVKKTKMSVAKKIGTTYDKIRMFFSGKEMKNDMQLWNYNVDNDVVIMVMVSP
jgi:hypothetical protein